MPFCRKHVLYSYSFSMIIGLTFLLYAQTPIVMLYQTYNHTPISLRYESISHSNHHNNNNNDNNDNESLFHQKIKLHILCYNQYSADESWFLVIGETIVESSAYLKRTGQPLKKISKSFKNILKRYGPLTLPCVVPLLTDFQCPKKIIANNSSLSCIVETLIPIDNVRIWG